MHSRPTFSRNEKLIVWIALLLLIVGLLGFFIDTKQKKIDKPIHSGTYTEGVIADSPTKVDRIVARLTSTGLTYRDSDGSIKPALAETWDISSDNKTYTFHLHDGYSAEGLLATIQNSKTNWSGITVTAPDDATLQFALSEPLSLFLPTTTIPLFPYGPYKVIKRDKQEIILRTNPDFVLGEAYITKIVIKQYKTHDELVKAAENKEIDGSADFGDTPPRGFEEHVIALPRYYILFFNTTKPGLKKTDDRLRIINATDGPPVTYTLVTSQNGLASDLANKLAESLSSKKITLTIQKKTSAILQKEDIGKREFDLLLYGIDYGLDRDYYPFWHSSQATASGLNIDGIKDKQLDGLLETARKEPNSVARDALNTQIEDYLTKNALQKVLDQEKFHFWIKKSIRGQEYGTMNDGNDRFALVWRWYIKSKKSRQ